MKKKRIYIVPTLFSITLGTLLLFVAISSAASNMFVVSAFVLSGIVVGIFGLIQTNKNLNGLAIIRMHSLPTPSGSKIPIVIVLHNHSNEPRHMIEISLKKKLFWHNDPTTVIEKIAANSSVEINLSANPKTRGIYKSTDIRIASRFPFGVAYAWSFADSFTDLIVYPKPHGDKNWPLIKSDNELQANKLSEGDFWSHRAYQYGDNLKHIDWKLFARSRNLQVKQFANTETFSHLFKYNELSQMNHEERLEQISLWVNRAFSEGHLFGLELGKDKIPVAPAYVNYTQALRLLAKGDA
jgi:uncharacterized protein (DUF58 family)